MQKLVFTIVCYLILCYSINLNGQFHYDKTKVSLSTQQYVDSIDSVKYYASLGINTGQFEINLTDDSLFKTLPAVDIRYLSKHPNPYLRAYAYKYFNEKASIDESYKLLKQHFLDTTQILCGTYCLNYVAQVFDVMYSEFKMLANGEDSIYNYYFFSIDSFIIKNIGNRYCNALDYAILNIGTNDLFYNDIKKLAVKNYPSAIIGLAKYKKLPDIEIIINSDPNLNYFEHDNYFYVEYSQENIKLSAIENFPNQRFDEILGMATDKYIEGDDGIIFEMLCSSLAAQKTKFSYLQLLKIKENAKIFFDMESSFEKCKIVSLAKAIYDNLNPTSEELSIDIAKEYSIINDHFIKYFKDKHPKLVDSVCQEYINLRVKKVGHREELLFDNDCWLILPESNLIYQWLIERNPSFLKDKLKEAIGLRNDLFKHKLYALFLEKGIEKNVDRILKEINNDLDNGIDIHDVSYIYINCDSKFKKKLKKYLESEGHNTSIYFDNW